MGKYLLTSDGLSDPQIVNALAYLTGRPLGETRITVVTTAANAEPGDKSWLFRNLQQIYDSGFGYLDMIEPLAVPCDVWQPRLEASDVLCFGGGNTFYLKWALERSGLERALPELLGTRVYLGISAGSTVAGSSLALSGSSRDFSAELGRYSGNRGLHLVPFQFRPHLNSPGRPSSEAAQIRREAKAAGSGPVWAMADGAALMVEGPQVSAVGPGETLFEKG